MEKALALSIPISAISSLYTHHTSSQYPARDSILQSSTGPIFYDVRPRMKHIGSWRGLWDTEELLGHLWWTKNSRAQSDLAKVASILCSQCGPQHALCAGPHPDFPRWRSTSFAQEWNPGMDQCVWSTGPRMKQQAHQHRTAQPWRTCLSPLGCCEGRQHLPLSLAEPHQEDTVLRTQWMCKGERE